MGISSKEARYKDLYNSIRSFCFFGPPLGGLHTKELEEMVVDKSEGQDEATLEFLVGLREKSRFLTQHRRDLVELWEGKKVLTFYEEVKTPTVKKVCWEMGDSNGSGRFPLTPSNKRSKPASGFAKATR